MQGGGGTARHIHGLATALAHLGHEVRVIAPVPAAVAEPYHTRAATPRDFAGHVAWADVVHVHGARSTYALKAAVAAWRAGKPFFYTAHCWYGPRSRRNALAKAAWDQTAERFLLSRCAKTVILTEYWRGYLAAKRLPTDRLIVIPNCVLEAELHTLPPGTPVERLAGRPAIISVGRLSPEKRGRDLIAALATPQLAEAQAHIVGKGPDRAELEALAGRHGVADRTHFYGFVSDEDVARMTAGSDAFVLASEEEGLPTIILEMILARIPVVCTAIPGNLAITETAGLTTTYPVGEVAKLSALLAGWSTLRIDDAMTAAVRRSFTWEGRAPEIAGAYAAAVGRQ